MAIYGVIFDIDGTLLLSNDAQAQAWVVALQNAGYDIPFARVRPLIGMGGDRLLTAFAPGLTPHSGPGKAIADNRQEIFLRDYAPSLHPTPGARDLVARLTDFGLRLVVGSSAKKAELDALLTAAHVQDLLTEAATADDARESKPSPDIVAAALAKLALPPENVVMLGDTPYDVQSAHRAGVKLIAVRCGGFSAQDLADADAIYTDPADVLAHLVSSPLADAAPALEYPDAPHAITGM